MAAPKPQELPRIQQPMSSKHPAMRLIEGGTFTMGSKAYYPEEHPLRRVRVDRFWIDETPVTNRDFARFVEATGYRTIAEFAPAPNDYPGMLPEYAQPGSLVFTKTSGPVPLTDYHLGWSFTVGADWRSCVLDRAV